jgi:DNA-binding NarL/FixJ family response regulator
MPPTNTDEGIRVAKQIRSEHPNVGVLLLSQYVEEEYAHELLAGDKRGLGYLLKDRIADVDEFASAVRRIAEGGTVLDPALE